MSGSEQLDVLIAVYLIPDLAQDDFDGYVKLAKEGTISTDGVVLVTKDADGEVARKRLEAGIGEKMDDALPPGSAGIIAIYDSDDAEAVAKALSNNIRSSTSQIDKASAKELKAGLEEASAGLAG